MMVIAGLKSLRNSKKLSQKDFAQALKRGRAKAVSRHIEFVAHNSRGGGVIRGCSREKNYVGRTNNKKALRVGGNFYKRVKVMAIGEIKLQELTPTKLDEWLRKLLHTGLSKNTLSAVHTLIHNALNQSVAANQIYLQARLLLYNAEKVSLVCTQNAGRKILKNTQNLYAYNPQKLQEEAASIFAKTLQTKP